MPRFKSIARKERGESSQSRSYAPLHENLGINFPTQASALRFASLSARQIKPTKFVDRATLRELGVYNGVRDLFGRIDADDLLKIYAQTFKRITLEVLSTFSCSMTDRWMRFQVFNEPKILDFDHVGDIFGIEPGYDGEPFTYNSSPIYPANAFWHRISDTQADYDSQRSKGSSILHPCLRIAHRILSSTIFCRSDSGTVLSQELFLLHGMVEYLEHVSLDGGALIAQKLLKVAESTVGDICCGGLITWLITESRLQVVIPEEEVPVEGLDRLNIEAFTRFHFLRKVGRRYSWLVGPHHTHHSYLPDRVRTRVNVHTDWLFPPPQEEGQEQAQEGGQHHHPHAQPRGLEERLDDLTHQVSQNTTTLANLERNLYGYFRHQGYEPQEGP
jgi:hypothetical protein